MARRRQVAALVLLLAASACQPSVRESQVDAGGDAITRAEAVAFGQALARVQNDCTPQALSKLWRIDVALARLAAAEHLPSELHQALLARMTSEAQWTRNCQLFETYGSHRALVAVHEVDGSYRPVIRLLTTKRLDYTEIELQRFGDDVRALDQYIYARGENLVAGLPRLLRIAQTLATQGAPIDPKLLGEFFAARDARNHAALIAAHEALPPVLHDDKQVMSVVLASCADNGDDDAYLALIERFERLFPGDPSLDIVSLAGFRLRKDYPRLHTAIDRLRQRVDDPYLDVLHAEAHLDEGDPPKAMTAVERALDRDPTLEPAIQLKARIAASLR